MDSSVLEQEIKRLKNLKTCKDMAEEEVFRLAKINLRVRDFKSRGMFNEEKAEGKKEQDLAVESFKSYLHNYELETDSDLDTLRSLVFNEVFEVRLQNELNKLAGDGKYPPEQLTKQLTSIQAQKLQLKLKLNIDREDKTVSELTQLQKLQKRFDSYIEEHRNEFTIACGCCGELLLLKRRVKDFDAIKHPYFAGRWFFNYEMLKDVKDGKLSKEDCWKYMTCASSGGEYKDTGFSKEYCIDYIDYCLNHWAEIISHFENKG